MTKQIVALLPMKAHSERVPGKNFRTLAGKPLARWMLDSLLGWLVRTLLGQGG